MSNHFISFTISDVFGAILIAIIISLFICGACRNKIPKLSADDATEPDSLDDETSAHDENDAMNDATKPLLNGDG